MIALDEKSSPTSHSPTRDPFQTATMYWRRRKPPRGPFWMGVLLSLVAIYLYVPQWYNAYIYELPCRQLPGAKDTVLVMKTGVTQLVHTLPAHLESTLQCAKNNLIFSDHSEVYENKWQIRDVFANLNNTYRQENDDFALWRLVKDVTRQGLTPEMLSGDSRSSKSSREEKMQVGGWVLDKWKFLPMLDETMLLYPNQKWYVFMETDTYLFWSTTIKYLSALDSTKPVCIGHRSTVKSDYPFAHGGSGYMFSNSGLRMVVDYYRSHRREMDEFVAAEWAGDIALGMVLETVGLPITPAWPIYQPHHFGILDFSLVYQEKRFWCYPSGSFHHMTPETVRDMWEFEQEWIAWANPDLDPEIFMRHSDVFNGYIMPRMRFPQYDWDNQSDDVPSDPAGSMEDCRDLCVANEECVQYRFDTLEGNCTTLESARLGEAKLGSGIYSDWIFERIEAWRDKQPDCEDETFIWPEDISERTS